MEIVIFAIGVVASFMVAWKAVEWLKPYHAGKAALFAMAVALLGPEAVGMVVAALKDTTDILIQAELTRYDALIKIAGGKMSFALLAVLTWCAGEALAGTKRKRLRIAADLIPVPQEDILEGRSRNGLRAPRGPDRAFPFPMSDTSRRLR
jgi:hypothetical protein